MELILTSKSGPEETRALTVEDLRSADCRGIPSEEVIERTLLKVDLDSVENLSKKKAFCLEAKNITDEDGAVLLWACALHGHNELSDIAFPRNELGPRFSATLADYLRVNTSIVKIDLHDNHITDACVPSFVQMLSINSSLSNLRLSNNQITREGASTLFNGIKTNYGLQYICMEAAPGTMNPGLAIRPLKGILPADQIDLASRHFGVLSTLLVCKIISHYKPQLTELAIDRNPLLEAGAMELCDMLKHNDDIRVLDVRFCALGPAGMSAICEGLRVNTSIERVLALSNNLGADGCTALEQLLTRKVDHSQLKYIDVQDNLFPQSNKISLRAVAEKQCPDLKLVIDAVDGGSSS